MRKVFSCLSVSLIMVLGLFFSLGFASSKQETRLKVVFDNPTYDFELQRTLGVTLSGGADINECLVTGNKIIQGDSESWYKNWRALADQVLKQGYDSLLQGRHISARQAFQRACNYYRTCEFFLHGNPQDPRILEASRLSRESFRLASQSFPYSVVRIRIPYEKTSLPGYFIKPDKDSQKRKTLIIQTGFDGTGEELYFTRGIFALQRGYNVMIFEGPGQGAALREQHLYFRSDWEKVITPVVDYCLARPEVDPTKVALMGISMGGYLVPRAAAFEHRLKAVIANPGTFDLYASNRSELPEMRRYPDQSNGYIRLQMKKNIGFRWFINNGMFCFNAKSPVDFLLAWSEYELSGLVTKIKTNTLCVVSHGDHFINFKDLRKLYDKLQCRKTLMIFSDQDFAPGHCQMGALAVSSERILNWLDDALEQ